MNMTLFRIFKYLIKYESIVVQDFALLCRLFDFLHIFSLCDIQRLAIRNMRKITNDCITMIVNKCNLEENVAFMQFMTVSLEDMIKLL